MSSSHFKPLTIENLEQGLDFPDSTDPDLAQLRVTLGSPPMWARAAGFATLVHIILEQQVSLASARAAFTKLKGATNDQVKPDVFLRFDNEELKKIGFSRQKTAACRALATAVLEGTLNLDKLPEQEDQDARSALMSVKGIGPWTADIYLLMVLLRQDSWPAGDLALATAIQELKCLPKRPDPTELLKISIPWQPWRAVAARLLWFSYLRKRGLA